MFGKILIANRGEIACRVMRTAARMGVRTVAVYSEADAGARHVALADEALAIGPAAARESYLNIERILAATRRSGAEAIHPGYGFLSENPDFASACADAGIVFIGPPAAAIAAMGSKAHAKLLMDRAGVPVVPGYHGDDQSDAALKKEAARVGWPILIKASAGGGGKGMRVVRGADGFAAALESCRREARVAFDDDRVLLEKYLEQPRHVEVQVFRDRLGNAVHLFERDCSIQRRHQKVLEEAPAPGLSDTERAKMGGVAVAAANAIDYLGAGTVEFIRDTGGSFYFMEMNTRLQVEHPVTELVTGQDLVEWQLRVANGQPLPLTQQQLALNGHAIEVRLYAEDPERDFLPATGHLEHLRFPTDSTHIRVDSGVRAGDVITVYYDPLIAKLIVWGRNRDDAVRRLQNALADTQVAGLRTNIDLLASIAAHPEFRAGRVDTGFIERYREGLLTTDRAVDATALAIAALHLLTAREQRAVRDAQYSAEPGSPWHLTDGWRLNGERRELLRLRSRHGEHSIAIARGAGKYLLHFEAGTIAATARHDNAGDLIVSLDGRTVRATVVPHGAQITVLLSGAAHDFTHFDQLAASQEAGTAAGSLASPMPGRIVDIRVKPGDKVQRGDTLVIIEAMKMEHAVTAPAAGQVGTVHFQAGDMVNEGVELLVLDAE
ncbi:MAG: acetyl/propionyl/methylcrotonyl-CoA carboxylase subunit alpha [Gammaproteobacteria bacterium]|nr:acetyl/propionyl/methylcrotonyl-CoA carboxylase subunit alpha [Gammaproteobacteria bacterium]